MWLTARVVLALSLFMPCLVHAGSESDVEVGVDRRVELVAVMARLAGFDEYKAPGIAQYDQAIHDHFDGFRNHPSIQLLNLLREQRGIAYNAPIEMALIAQPETWKPLVDLSPWPVFLDSRWDAPSAEAFLAAAAKFEQDTKAQAFFDSQQPIFDQVRTSVAGNLAGRLHANWYQTRMPNRDITGFKVVPALLAGPNSYGPHIRYRDGHEEVFGILATPEFGPGAVISYPANSQLALLVHEYHHSYMNPWADEQAELLMPAADTLFAAVQPRMKELAYGQARIMLYETLVRANTLRYLRHYHETDVLAAAIAEDRSKGFPWTPELADLLDSLDQSNGKLFVTDTARRIAVLLHDWGQGNGARISAEMERLAAEEQAHLAKGPQILQFVPAQDAMVGTDFGMLEIHFDRPMSPGLAIFGDLPEVAGNPTWDEAMEVLRLPVKLSPGARYHLYLNSRDSDKMRSANGEPLVPREWWFSVSEP